MSEKSSFFEKFSRTNFRRNFSSRPFSAVKAPNEPAGEVFYSCEDEESGERIIKMLCRFDQDDKRC